MNRLLTLAATALLAVPAFAEDAVATPAAADAQPQVQAETREPFNCLKETGSRIKPAEDRPCIGAPGQVYTRDDIDRTGATTTAEALRKLSPSVR